MDDPRQWPAPPIPCRSGAAPLFYRVPDFHPEGDLLVRSSLSLRHLQSCYPVLLVEMVASGAEFGPQQLSPIMNLTTGGGGPQDMPCDPTQGPIPVLWRPNAAQGQHGIRGAWQCPANGRSCRGILPHVAGYIVSGDLTLLSCQLKLFKGA